MLNHHIVSEGAGTGMARIKFKNSQRMIELFGALVRTLYPGQGPLGTEDQPNRKNAYGANIYELENVLSSSIGLVREQLVAILKESECPESIWTVDAPWGVDVMFWLTEHLAHGRPCNHKLVLCGLGMLLWEGRRLGPYPGSDNPNAEDVLRQIKEEILR